MPISENFPIKFSDVTQELWGVGTSGKSLIGTNSNIDAFAKAVDNQFHPYYKGNKDRLSCFLGYPVNVTCSFNASFTRYYDGTNSSNPTIIFESTKLSPISWVSGEYSTITVVGTNQSVKVKFSVTGMVGTYTAELVTIINDVGDYVSGVVQTVVANTEYTIPIPNHVGNTPRSSYVLAIRITQGGNTWLSNTIRYYREDLPSAISSGKFIAKFDTRNQTKIPAGGGNTERSVNNNKKTILLPRVEPTEPLLIRWGDGSTQTITSTTSIEHSYTTAGIYTIEIEGNFSMCYGGYSSYYGGRLIGGDNYSSRDELLEILDWGNLKLVNEAFIGCTKLNLTNVVGIPRMSWNSELKVVFAHCPSLTGIKNIESWDTSNIVNMNGLFSYSELFNSDISTFDFSSIQGGTSSTKSESLRDILFGVHPNYDLSSIYKRFTEFSNLVNMKFFSNGKYYSNFQSYKEILINRGWLIADGGTF